MMHVAKNRRRHPGSTGARGLRLGLLALVLLAGGTTAAVLLSDDGAPPPVPANPFAQPVHLLQAFPFELDRSYAHAWRRERPQVSGGIVLVLRVDDPTLLHPRQGYEPVLFVGEQTAERINLGHVSGHLVVVVPETQPGSGVDLSRAPIFFGDPALPEEMDVERAAQQLQRALEKGLRPPTPETLAAAQATTRALLRFPDKGELDAWCADLIATYSPAETDLVQGLRAPRLRR